MNIQTFLKYMNCELPASAGKADFAQLQSRYPWFSISKVLLLKALKDTNDPQYEKELPITALYARNRKNLRTFLQKETKPAEAFVLDIGASIEKNDEFLLLRNQTDKLMSFGNEYFSLEDEIVEPTESFKDELISKFIKSNPKIVPTTQYNPENNMFTEEPEEPVSEMLAEIYVKQGLYNKAIECYSKLILINPEKSAYFADLIKKLNI